MMNKAMCKERCEEIKALIKQYKGKYQELRNEFNEKVVSEEFAIGGVDMHRGYYCPSLVFDIHCDVSRGSLCTRDSGRKYTYRYGFDSAGWLVLVESKNPTGYEFIMHDENSEIGIRYDKSQKVKTVIECQYYSNGRIKSFEYFDGLSQDNLMSYESERYEYFEDYMLVEEIRYTEWQELQTMTHEIANFKVENGYLTQYNVKSYVDGVLMDTPRNGWVWKVDIKRSIL